MSEKKGIPAWGWVLMGCGGIALVGVIAVVGLGVFAVKKAGEFAEDFDKNPAYATVAGLAMFDPNLEVTGRDDDTQSVTVKNLETGEEVTINMEDIEQGRISWIDSSGNTVKIDASDETQGVNVTTNDGQMSYGGTAAKIPNWLEVLEDANYTNAMSQDTPQETTGILNYTTKKTPEEIIAYYRGYFEREGWEVVTQSIGTVQTISGEGGNYRVAVSVATNEQTGEVGGNLSYTHTKQ